MSTYFVVVCHRTRSSHFARARYPSKSAQVDRILKSIESIRNSNWKQIVRSRGLRLGLCFGRDGATADCLVERPSFWREFLQKMKTELHLRVRWGSDSRGSLKLPLFVWNSAWNTFKQSYHDNVSDRLSQTWKQRVGCYMLLLSKC